MPPIDTVTGAFPADTAAGIFTLIWKTPTGASGAAPAYVISACRPPMVAVTGAHRMVEYGVEMLRSPERRYGDTVPSPVPKREITLPRAAGLAGPLMERS